MPFILVALVILFALGFSIFMFLELRQSEKEMIEMFELQDRLSRAKYPLLKRNFEATYDSPLPRDLRE